MATTIHPNNFIVSLWENDATSDAITVTGWSDSGTALSFGDIEPYANIRQGLDGQTYGILNARFAVPVTFELMSNSPTIKWMQGVLNKLRNGENIQINGEVTNGVSREVISLRGGLLQSARPFPNFGTDGPSVMTFVVRFTDVPADYSNFVADFSGGQS